MPRVSGEVIDVPVEANKPIKKGEVLFRIDPLLFQAAVANAEAPFAVRLILGEAAAALELPSGATGSVVIYSGIGGFAHVIRKVELRLEAIMNYVNPF